MANQRGFPDKLNVPTRKIQNKSMGDFQLCGDKGKFDVDNISISKKIDVGRIKTLRATGISGESPDICCEDY